MKKALDKTSCNIQYNDIIQSLNCLIIIHLQSLVPLLLLSLQNFPEYFFLLLCPHFRINSCPNNCSGHGRCSTANSVSGRVYCECQDYWKGEACNIPYCRNNCGSPDRGYCDLTGEKLCVCNDSWQGERGRNRTNGKGRLTGESDLTLWGTCGY